MFTKEKKAISTIILVAVIVVIVAIAGAGTYYVLTLSPSSSTTQSTTNSQQTTSSSHSSSSSSSSAVSQTSSSSQASTSLSTTTSANLPLSAISNTKNLFGNFSQMTMMFSSENKSSGVVYNATWSFHVMGTATINGTQLRIVNYTLSSTGQSSGNYSAIFYYNPDWNVTMITMEGQNYTGTMANAFTGLFSVMFVSFFSYQQEYAANQNIFSQFVQVSTHSQNFGGVTMQVTTYTASNIVTANATIQSASLGIGQIPNTALSILTYVHFDESVGSQQLSYTLALISATRA
jgi:hypothetical protein